VHQERRRQRLDTLGGRLATARNANFAAHRQRIVRDAEKIVALFERGGRAVTRLIEKRHASLERATGLLAALSYHGVLARGFALVRDPAGHPLRSAVAVSAGLALDIEFHDGHVGAVANGEGVATAPPAAPAKAESPRAKPRRGGGEGQGSLFG
jgi:exodeoxyribonuclease VII large subunit